MSKSRKSRKQKHSPQSFEMSSHMSSVVTVIHFSYLFVGLHRGSKKQDTKLLAITSPTIIRFSYFLLADSVVNLQQTHV